VVDHELARLRLCAPPAGAALLRFFSRLHLPLPVPFPRLTAEKLGELRF